MNFPAPCLFCDLTRLLWNDDVQVVFKMDRYGNGEEIVLDKVLNVVGRVPSFMNFNTELFAGTSQDLQNLTCFQNLNI